MALGVPGTGPYGRIRMLEEEIEAYKYEVSLIDQGMKRRFGRKTYEKMIIGLQRKVAEIRAEIRAEKQKQRRTP